MNIREIGGFVVLYASALFCAGLLVVAGCADSVIPNSTASATTNAYLLDAEPTGALDVLEAKAAVADNPEVVLIGRINAGNNEPWEQGRAAFMVTDAATMIDVGEDSGAHSADCNCHFCNRDKSANDSLAVVKIVDDQGEVVPIDARELLDVEQNQIVVVKGTGAVDALGNLTIAAKGIYVRR